MKLAIHAGVTQSLPRNSCHGINSEAMKFPVSRRHKNKNDPHIAGLASPGRWAFRSLGIYSVAHLCHKAVRNYFAMRTLQTIQTIGAFFLFALFFCLPLQAQQARKTLHVGQSEIYVFDRMTTAAVGSPLIADIVPLSSRQLLVNAKSVGETTLLVCDHAGTHLLRLSVVPVPVDLRPMAALVQAAIGLPGVTAHAVQDTLFLEGAVSSTVAWQRASAIAEVYAPKIKNLLTVTLEAPQGPTLAQTYAALLTPTLAPIGITVQVIDDKTIALSGQYAGRLTAPGAAIDSAAWPAPQPRKKAAGKRAAADAADDSPDPETASPDSIKSKGDAKTSASESLPSDPLDHLVQSLPPDLKVINLLNLGPGPTRQILVRAKIIDIDRTASKSLGVDWGTGGAGVSRGGSTYAFQSQPILFGQLGSPDFYSNPLSGGSLKRISPLAAQLSALITENKARILSEPSLMVLDGCEGSILVGGEIPIPVAQASSGTGGVNASVTIEYKPYGVRLLVSAALVGDKTVQLTVTPEVSDLDYGAGIQISGFSVPALTVRRATSTLQMADGETLVIGGLYSNTVSRQVNRIPLLSQIPVLGEFFKSTTTHKEENELLILIQPEIVNPSTVGAYPPPAGSLENLPIQRPDVGKTDFDKDFPGLQPGGGDKEKPDPPVSLPVQEPK
jgi:Flp pilus assembly secretin CpaC